MHRSRDRALSDDFILASPRLISCTELEASGKKHRHYFENLKFRGTFQNLQTSWEACKMSAMFVTIRKRPVFELLCLNTIFEGVENALTSCFHFVYVLWWVVYVLLLRRRDAVVG